MSRDRLEQLSSWFASISMLIDDESMIWTNVHLDNERRATGKSRARDRCLVNNVVRFHFEKENPCACVCVSAIDRQWNHVNRRVRLRIERATNLLRQNNHLFISWLSYERVSGREAATLITRWCSHIVCSRRYHRANSTNLFRQCKRFS
jgi:hypothetical protein